MGAAMYRYARDSLEYGRAVAFFDAAYAFALTLLVVNVEPPPASAWGSLPALLDAGLGGHLLGFAMSFLVVAVFWRLNHWLLSAMAGLTTLLIVVSFVALACVVLIPFTTQGLSDPATSGTPLAVALYAIDVSAAGIANSALYWCARAQGMLRVRLSPRIEILRLFDAVCAVGVFLASIGVAYIWGADAARWSWLTLIPLAVLSSALRRREARRTAPGA
ncbi:TMEM175 family protein [Agromyces archimandritae]|uniref:DUF1211 domain-containing protein n=1 Tax=Agromyces archimandritae TaxID=2781962 RepID=A0A975FKZ4_9MICO|nr:TMEM175 family protein [Agromyces archimandritae]QTX04015.1 DUF1211 domain-containing protein [Agromyces archimandritae]